MKEYEACVLKGIQQMPLVALEKCLIMCENTPKQILLTGAISSFMDDSF